MIQVLADGKEYRPDQDAKLLIQYTRAAGWTVWDTWAKRAEPIADEASDGFQVLVGGVCVVKSPRHPTREKTREWMQCNARSFGSATQLAEAAPVPYRWLDDEDHWIWEEAARCFDE